MIHNPHMWEPTDNQGYCMQCVKCGKNIIHPSLSNIENDDWTEGDCTK